MTVTWNIDPGAYFAAITQQRVDAVKRDIVALVERLTDEVVAWMQQNARWQDDTGRARAGLWSDIEETTWQVYLLMSHDVTLDYTWFLEYAHAGRFEILSSASDHFWPVLYRGVVEIVRRHSD